MKFLPFQKVRPKTEKDAFKIGQTFISDVTVDTVFTILVVVNSAKTWNKENERGLIVRHPDESSKNYYGISFPYVWDFRRFVPAN